MIAWLLAGCGAWLHYEPVLYPTSPAPRGANPRAWLEEAVRGGLILRAEGQVVAPADLPEPVAWVAWTFAGHPDRGAEFDVTYAGLHIEVVRALAGDTDLRWAPVAAPAESVPPPLGLTLIDGGAAWTASERAAVGAAVALLDAQILPYLEDVPLQRERVSPRRPRVELSWYETRTRPPRIELFDLAFDADVVGFAGDPAAPVSASSTSVLHEFGHAFADAPARLAYHAYLATLLSGDDSRDAWRRYLETFRRDPVITTFRGQEPRPGPTPYGRRRIHEAFAESFYLFYADPEALRRVRPDLHAWFDAGGHLHAVREPD